jgi:hypothetical protein
MRPSSLLSRWLEHEPVLDTESQERIRAALKHLPIS